jgi:hypothetical protein
MITPARLRFYRLVFAASAVYNVLWGTAMVLFPLAPFRLIGIPDPNYPEFWQCIGMFVMTYAIGYAYLAADPVRYAPFALVALAGKVLGPIGWAWAYSRGRLPGVSGVTILTNDLIWWVPYAMFLSQTVFRRGGSDHPTSPPAKTPREPT